MEDRYLDVGESYKRLKKVKQEHNHLFIAFDFDDTVYPCTDFGDSFPKIESLLRLAKSQGHKLILFTANEGERLQWIIKWCEQEGYAPDFVNENPLMATRKPYYNILLDDRAGLYEAYTILYNILTE